MEIKEKDLLYLLESRKHHIKTRDFLVQNIICLLSFIITVFASNVLELPFSSKVVISVCGLFYLVLFVFSVYGANYSPEALFNDIASSSETHAFSLVIIKNEKGEYLLKKDSRWKTYLFPFKRTKENDVEDLKDFLSQSFGVKEFSLISEKQVEITKKSVSAQMAKTYHHVFYHVKIDSELLPKHGKFRVNKEVYRWLSIDEMKANKDMIFKNRETIDFVEKNF